MNNIYSMFLEFMTSKFFFVIPMLVGGFAFWFLARFARFGTSITKAEVKQEVMNGNVAMAVLFGFRILAVGIAVGLFVIAGAIL